MVSSLPSGTPLLAPNIDAVIAASSQARENRKPCPGDLINLKVNSLTLDQCRQAIFNIDEQIAEVNQELGNRVESFSNPGLTLHLLLHKKTELEQELVRRGDCPYPQAQHALAPPLTHPDDNGDESYDTSTDDEAAPSYRWVPPTVSTSSVPGEHSAPSTASSVGNTQGVAAGVFREGMSKGKARRGKRQQQRQKQRQEQLLAQSQTDIGSRRPTREAKRKARVLIDKVAREKDSSSSYSSSSSEDESSRTSRKRPRQATTVAVQRSEVSEDSGRAPAASLPPIIGEDRPVRHPLQGPTQGFTTEQLAEVTQRSIDAIEKRFASKDREIRELRERVRALSAKSERAERAKLLADIVEKDEELARLRLENQNLRKDPVGTARSLVAEQHQETQLALQHNFFAELGKIREQYQPLLDGHKAKLDFQVRERAKAEAGFRLIIQRQAARIAKLEQELQSLKGKST